MSTAPSALPSGQTSVIDISEKPTPARFLNDGSETDLAADGEKGQITPQPASPPPEMSRTVEGWKWVLVCIGFYFSGFLYGLDNTIAADIQSAVVDTYGDISKLTWLGTGFPLGSIATILTLYVISSSTQSGSKLTVITVGKRMVSSTLNGFILEASHCFRSAVLSVAQPLT